MPIHIQVVVTVCCRRSHDVLRRALPPKEEHVILVKMSAIQRSLYKAFMDSLEQTDMGEMASANPLKAFSVCCKVNLCVQLLTCYNEKVIFFSA